MVRALATSVVLLLLGGALWRGTRAEGAPEVKPPSKEALAAAEVKLLLPVLRVAVKDDFRRQAWYLATRILLDDAKNPDAEATLRTWKGADLEDGREPTKPFLAMRDAALRKVGDAYARFWREAAAAGPKENELFPILERAIAFGTADGDAYTAIEDAGYAWRGTYGSVKKGLVETALGTLAKSIAFPSEFDDTVLRYRCVWPDAKVVEFGRTRLVSTLSSDDTWRTVSLLTTEESYFVRTFGSNAKDSGKDKDEDPHTDLVVAPDAATYSILGEAFVPADQHADFEGTSAWYRPSRRRLLMLAPVRDNPWTGRDAAILGQAVRPMIRRHFGAGTSTWLHGRGAWFLDGFVGAFESFAATGPDVGDVDPARCWRLAAMRELHDRAAFISWDALFAMDVKQAIDAPKRDVTFLFGGEKREGKQLSVPTAQATALVFAIWQMDGGKGPKKLAALAEDVHKRNGLPDIDKALGLAPGKTVEMTEAFIRESAPK